MSLNKRYNCGENEVADMLLAKFDNVSVLSPSFVSTIDGIVLMIVTNLNGNEELISKRIVDLITEMHWLSIFSSEFINSLRFDLLLALGRQKAINKSK